MQKTDVNPAALHRLSAAPRQSGAPLGASAHSDWPDTRRAVPSRPTAPTASTAPFAMLDAASAADLVVSLACPPTAPSVDFRPLFISSQPLFMLVTDSSNQCPSVSNQPGFCSSGFTGGWAAGSGAAGEMA